MRQFSIVKGNGESLSDRITELSVTVLSISSQTNTGNKIIQTNFSTTNNQQQKGSIMSNKQMLWSYLPVLLAKLYTLLYTFFIYIIQNVFRNNVKGVWTQHRWNSIWYNFCQAWLIKSLLQQCDSTWMRLLYCIISRKNNSADINRVPVIYIYLEPRMTNGSIYHVYYLQQGLVLLF